MKKQHFIVQGKVQGVMFRQTFIRAAQNRGLKAAATNENSGNEVSCYLEGEQDKVDEILTTLKKGQPINSWGAQVTAIIEKSEGRSFEDHQVTTENVDSFNWSPNVEMYL